jgi:hypothetical protein
LLFGPSGVNQEVKITNKLPFSRKKSAGQTDLMCASDDQKDGQWVGYLEKAIVKMYCNGEYKRFEKLSFIEVLKAVVGPGFNEFVYHDEA